MSLKLFVILSACLVAVTGQELCDSQGNGRFTAILPGSEGQLLVLKGVAYWVLVGNFSDGFNLVDTDSKKIASHWFGLPNYVDVDGATFDIDTGITYLVQGDEIWAFKGTELEEGYPLVVKEDAYFNSEEKDDSDDQQHVAKLTRESDAVGIFPSDLEHIYFFKGHKYSKYILPDGPIADGYPKDVAPFWFECPKSSSDEKE